MNNHIIQKLLLIKRIISLHKENAPPESKEAFEELEKAVNKKIDECVDALCNSDDLKNREILDEVLTEILKFGGIETMGALIDYFKDYI